LAKAVGRVLAFECDVVGIVRDGSAVLDAAQRLVPDVIVLDLSLPDVNGLDLCRQLRRSGFHNHIIVFTAMNDPVIVTQCFEAGASAFVSKVAREGDDDLVSTVKRLCVELS
jgi:DNA-binding NarL/FixJ family response regulator